MAMESDDTLDPMQEETDRARAFASAVGQGNKAAELLVLQAAINAADRARHELLRDRLLEHQAPRAGQAMPRVLSDSIYDDAVYQANADRLLDQNTRIIGGVPTEDFPDCVAVGAEGSWCCTGTIIAPSVVVTAAHCITGDCRPLAIFIGSDLRNPQSGRIIRVTEAKAHHAYVDDGPNDIGVLLLEEDVSVPPRVVGASSIVDVVPSVRLAGYGYVDVYASVQSGERRMVDVPLASNGPKFGADTATEFVAGAPFLDRDSCNGDSGGPAYAWADRRWQLVGVTSRATATRLRQCGDGGIYTRVHSFASWLQSASDNRWTTP